MTFWVCIGCGDIKDGSVSRDWASCVGCGFSPQDDETLTKQLLLQDGVISEKLLEISRKVKAREEISFDQSHLKMNWITLDFYRSLEAKQNAVDQRKCPDCSSQIEYVEEGLSCGWKCSLCPWGIQTTNPRAL